MLRLVSQRHLMQFICIMLLLVAQHGALTHAVWHAHEPLQHEQGHGRGDDAGGRPASESSLCGFDLAFNQVMGGMHAAVLFLFFPLGTAEHNAQGLHARLSAEALSARSRGPPSVL